MSDSNSLLNNPVAKFFRTVFMGCGQPMFAGNVISGLLIVAGIAYASWESAAWFVIGAAGATLAAKWMRGPEELIDIGMFTFPGGYAGAVVGGFITKTVGQVPLESWTLLILICLFAPVITMAFFFIASKFNNVLFTAAPVLVLIWLVLAGFLHGGVFTHPPAAAPEVAAAPVSWGWQTIVLGTLNAFGAGFMHPNPVTGAIILLALAFHSRISAAMGVLGCLVTATLAWATGVPPEGIVNGDLLFNSLFVVIGLAGFFLYFELRSVLYALIAGILALLIHVMAGVILKPWGLPPIVAAFVITTLIFMWGAQGLKFVTPVPVERLSKPEDSLLKNAPDAE